MIFRSLLFLLLFITCEASWVIPPDYEVVTGGGNGKTFLRKNNKDGVVEIRDSESLNVIWKTKVDEYHHVYSSYVMLNTKSDILIHIIGNHKILSLEQDCLAVYTKNGKQFTYKVKDFYSKLDSPNNAFKSSVSPLYHWIDKVNFIGETGVNLTLSNGLTVVLDLKKRGIITQK